MPTEHAVDAFAAEPIVVEGPLTGEQPESVRLDDRAPRPRLGANRAVALPRSSRQIEIRLEADGATVTAAKVGLQHGALRCLFARNRLRPSCCHHAVSIRRLHTCVAPIAYFRSFKSSAGRAPITAAALASELETSKRSVYRD